MSNLNDNFSFNETNEREAEKILAKYPTDRKQSAIMPLLDLAQRQNDNWLSRDVVEYVANFIEIPFIKSYIVSVLQNRYN